MFDKILIFVFALLMLWQPVFSQNGDDDTDLKRGKLKRKSEAVDSSRIRQGATQRWNENNEVIPADTSVLISDSLLITTDTSAFINDSLLTAADTLDFNISKDTLDAPVQYKARDSIIYDIEAQKVYLYGEAEVYHKQIELKAAYIEFDWGANVVSAEGMMDTLGKLYGAPVFKEGEQEYRAKKLAYNFKTKKGKVYDVITREGEGYLHGQTVKKTEEDYWYVKDAKYTTCNLEDPHFYISADKL